MTMYALIQTGYAIFGVGETVDAARADAAPWLDDDTDVNAVPAFDNLPAMFARTVYGDLAVVPCSTALAEYVRQHGTTDYDDSGNELRLPERGGQTMTNIVGRN